MRRFLSLYFSAMNSPPPTGARAVASAPISGILNNGSPLGRPALSTPDLLRSIADSPGPSLDSMSQLQRAVASVVKTRSGSVLSRGFILKTDYYPSGAWSSVPPTVYAPNFAPQAVRWISTSTCMAPPISAHHGRAT